VSSIEKQRAAESFANLCRGMMKGEGALTPREMGRIVVSVWMEQVGGVNKPGGPDEQTLASFAAGEKKEPAVLEQWGAMRAVMTPRECIEKGMSYIQAGELAFTDGYLDRLCGGQENAKQAALYMKMQFRQFRAEFGNAASAPEGDGGKGGATAAPGEGAPLVTTPDVPAEG
jgi:hypothetical protein